MDRGTIWGVPGWWKIQRRPHMTPVLLPVMIDLNFTKRAEGIGGSVVYERVPSVGEARIERRKHRAPVLIRGIVGRKVRVGQGAGITGGGEF